MFEIPDNLPLSLAPLAWVLGAWQGWGTGATPGEGDDRVVLQDITAQVDGEAMHLTTQLFQGEVTGELEMTMDAAAGLDVVSPGELIISEESTWRVTSPVTLTTPAEAGEQMHELAVTTHSNGQELHWAGVAMGPRIRLVSDPVDPAGNPLPSVSALEEVAPQAGSRVYQRMYGLVGGELFWTEEAVLATQEDSQMLLSGRLQRTSSAQAS